MQAISKAGKLDLVGGALLFQISASLTPSNLAFGNQTIGTKSSPQNATLTNVGSSALDITSIGITGDPKDFEQTNNCGSSLPPHSSCQIKVTFAPHSVGAKQASLSVSYKGLGSPQTVSLTGKGVSAGTVSLTPSSMTFATQLIKTASSPQAATLTNTGSVDVTISNILTSGPFGQTNTCPATWQRAPTARSRSHLLRRRKGQRQERFRSLTMPKVARKPSPCPAQEPK